MNQEQLQELLTLAMDLGRLDQQHDDICAERQDCYAELVEQTELFMMMCPRPKEELN